MTYSPTMKFYNLYFKYLINLIFSLFILTSCASLNTSSQTYNLEGKLSYISETESGITKVSISTSKNKTIIKIFDPMMGQKISELNGFNKSWNLSSGISIQFFDALPKPMEIFEFVSSKCKLAGKCEIRIESEDQDNTIKLILKNV